MFKVNKIIGLGLVLVALFASTAHAETISVNPGTVGGEAQDFNFDASTVTVDIVWADNKTLEWGAGTHIFLLLGPAGSGYVGILLDAAGNEIPGTELIGTTPTTADPGKAGLINLAETTVFSGIRLSSGGFFDQGFSTAWSWNWNSADRPLVGQTQASGNQPPVAEAGTNRTGQLGVPIAFDGSDSLDPDGSIARYDWDFGDGNSAPDAGPTPSHAYQTGGTFNAVLTVTDDGGLPDSDSVTVTIAGSKPPTANAGGPVTGTVNVPVAFDGSLSSDPEGSTLRYDWDFGDGTFVAATTSTPSHTYANNGEYTVILTVTDNDGETDDDTTTATIGIGNQAPTANAGPPAEGFLGDPVSFDGSLSSDPEGPIAQYDWDFGDGNTGTGVNPSHTYTAAGNYTVLLTVTDGDDKQDTASTAAAIDANPLEPIADAGQPVVGIANGPVDFNGSGSTDADGTIDSYSWDFGDGNTGTGETPSHTYTAPGLYPVTLTVTDNDGLTAADNTQAAIDQANAPPTSDAGGPYAGAMGALVLFNGSASSDADGDIVSAEWDFGDTTTGSGLYSTHTYTAPGSYTATLTVTDSDGDTDESNATVIIGDAAKLPPRPLTNGPYNGVAGVPLTFDGSNSSDPDGTINEYNWVFGDGNSLTGPTPSAVNNYVSGGLYWVLLQVVDNDALTVSDSTIARIGNLSLLPNAVASANNEPYQGRVGVPVAFNGGNSNDPDGDITRYDWDFGDGQIADDAGPTPTNVYATGGKYFARLTVTDDSGETDTDITVVNVGLGNLSPLADAGGSYDGVAGNEVSFDGRGSTDPDGEIASYDWEFGDGATASGPTPNHTYAEAKSYFVTLTVTDDDGTPSSDSTLIIIGAGSSIDEIKNLVTQVNDLDLPKGTKKALLAKLENALKKLEDGNVNNDQAAINVLRAFINEVSAQAGKKIDSAEASALIEAAESAIDSID